MQLLLNDAAMRTNKDIPEATKMAIGKRNLEKMPEYIAIENYLAAMKGSVKARKETLYSKQLNSLSAVMAAFVKVLEEVYISPPLMVKDAAPAAASEDEEDVEDNDEAPCSFHASGTVSVPRIFSWARADAKALGGGKNGGDSASPDEKEAGGALGRKASYVPQYTMCKVSWELWYGDVRKINKDSAKDIQKAHALIGDCPYGVDTSLEYDSRAWNVDDVGCFLSTC